MNFRRTSNYLAALLLWAAGARADQTVCVDLGQARPYNVFTLGDIRGANSDTEGAMAAGGNVTLQSYSIGAKLAQQQQALTVRGDFNYLYGGIGGFASVLGNFNAQSYGFSNGGSLRPPSAPSPVDFAAAFNDLRKLSDDLGALPDNGETINYWNNYTLRGTDPDRNVFTIDANMIWGLTVDVPSTSVAIVNMRGSWRGLYNFGVWFSRKAPLLYNFPDAQDILVTAIDPYGTVLAPRARLQFYNGALDGQVIAAQWVHGQYDTIGQVNLNPFTCVPMSRPNPCKLTNAAPDPACTGVVYVPGKNDQGVLMYEDLWPRNGDLDFNDEVVTYNDQLLVDATGKTTALRATFNVMAIGAYIHNGLYLHLPVPAGAVSSVVRTTSAGQSEVLQPLAGEAELVLQIAGDTRDLFARQDEYINTDVRFETQQAPAVSLLITFAQPVNLSSGDAPWDVFLAHTEDYAFQIHLPKYGGTPSANAQLFGTYDDRSTAQAHYVNEHGLPFALKLPHLIAWPQEKVEIDELYPSIVNWAASGGANAADWYLATPQGRVFTHGANGTLPPLPILYW
ncbi:MAG: LruC domain-containing protein [Deltaproteobacteria bacterium]|nr:LruC domain-containing protein [Deltaproteobacteria bacterium]